MNYEKRYRIFQPAGPIPPAPQGHDWQELMRCALKQARLAMKAREVPVGAIIVTSTGEIVGKAHNQTEAWQDPTAHAEILAIRMAAAALNNWRLYECVLVTTLEPCVMCAGAILHARLAGVVYGAADIFAGAISSSLDCQQIYPGNQVWHMGGVLSEECKELLEFFFHSRRAK